MVFVWDLTDCSCEEIQDFLGYISVYFCIAFLYVGSPQDCLQLGVDLGDVSHFVELRFVSNEDNELPGPLVNHIV